jgi:tetratricopeptide (TPR) repeat protein
VETARCKHCLAALRYFQRRFRESVQIYREILPIYRAHLGDDHLYVCECLDDYAASLHAVGRYRESEEILADAVRLTPTLLGGPWTGFSRMRRMGILQHANQQFDDAEESYRRALAYYCLYLADGTDRNADQLDDLAQRLDSDEPHHAVRPIYRDVFAAARPHLPDFERNAFIASLMTNVADLLLDLGELQLAEQLFRDAARIVGTAISSGLVDYDHWLRADIQSGIASCMAARGHYLKAEPFIIQAHRRTEESLGRGHLRTRLVLDRAVRLYERWGRSDQADHYRSLRRQAAEESNRPEGINLPGWDRTKRFPQPTSENALTNRVSAQ